MTQEPIEAVDFDKEQFGADFPGGSVAVEYLWDYLSALDAISIIREENYVDRHYLDDFTKFYARSFRVPHAKCRRLHFFSIPVHELKEHIERAYEARDEETRRRIEQSLCERYLGFVVRRPITGAWIGRAVLRTYPDDGARRYTVLRPYRVHLGGLWLTVNGIAFQQQDRQAAVCASIALWCALQKVAHLGGKRTPTPSQVTEAADSPYPASFGLTDPQTATALTRLGYSADTFGPDDPNIFRASVAACLRSHLPVILIVGGPDSGHVICTTGYREPSSIGDVSYGDPSDSIQMITATIQTIYAHDDNHGSHVHYEFVGDVPEALEQEWHDEYARCPLWLVRGRVDDLYPKTGWKTDCLPVLAAIVPKPWKVRMPVSDLLRLSWAKRHQISLIMDDLPIAYDVRFSTGVEYRRELLNTAIDRNAMQDFDWKVSLPRHIGIISVMLHDGLHICDLVLDATTVDASTDDGACLIAVVGRSIPTNTLAWRRLQTFAEDEEVIHVGLTPHESPVQKQG